MKKIILLFFMSVLFANAFANKDELNKSEYSTFDWYLGSESVAFTSILTVTSNVTTICPGTGGSATLTASGCTAGEIIQWYLGYSGVSFTSGNNIISVSPSSTQLYFAKCTDAFGNTIISSNPITITIVSNPTSISKNPNYNVSPGSNITLYPNGCASGNGIRWEDNSTSNPRVVSPSIVTSYSFKCTFSSCESPSSSSITITPAPAPPTITSSSTSSCSGANVSLTATDCGASNYVEWYLGSSSVGFVSNNLAIIVNPTVNSTYSARCIGSTGFSSSSNLISININEVSEPVNITKSPSGIINPGLSVSLTANGCIASGNTVKWENNSSLNPRSVTPLITTTFSFRCINGVCESATSANTTVQVLPSPPSITLIGSNTICSGTSATLNATGCESPNIVQWFLGSASVSFTSGNASISVSPTTNSSYTAKCTSTLGNSTVSNSISINVISVNIPFSVSASPSSTIGPNTNVSLAANGCGGNTIKWEDNSTANPRIVTPISTSTYSFKCVNGICESPSSSNITITVQPCPNNITLVSNVNNISSGTITYQSSASNGVIIASNKILGVGTFATYNAGKSISLTPGFLADNSTVFLAEIGGCL